MVFMIPPVDRSKRGKEFESACVSASVYLRREVSEIGGFDSMCFWVFCSGIWLLDW
jgi:hypothetical protein